jgi:hypothetical protein
MDNNRKSTAKLNTELLIYQVSELKNEIRDGFHQIRTDNADLIKRVGAIELWQVKVDGYIETLRASQPTAKNKARDPNETPALIKVILGTVGLAATLAAIILALVQGTH